MPGTAVLGRCENVCLVEVRPLAAEMAAETLSTQAAHPGAPVLWRLAEIGSPNSSLPPYRLELLQSGDEYVVQASYASRRGQQTRSLVRTKNVVYAVREFEEKVDERLRENPGHAILRAEGTGPQIPEISADEAAKTVARYVAAKEREQEAKQRTLELRAVLQYYCDLHNLDRVAAPDGTAFAIRLSTVETFRADPALIRLLLERNLLGAIQISAKAVREAIEDGHLTLEEVLPYVEELPQVRCVIEKPAVRP